MTFAELSTYFDKLEQTSSRLSLIDILADLFRNVQQEEIEKVIYLMQGRVAPFYAPIELGMADKMVAAALAVAFEKEREFVLSEYARKGDMGLVAEELRKLTENTECSASVSDIFDSLLSIAHTSGEGSVEKKIGQFASIVQKLDATSSKHLVRIALGKTRLGIGDPTVLDGLATAILGDKSQRKLLEKAYNETSDLGLIGKTLCTGGLDEVKKLTVTVGRPIRSQLCERLPTPEKVFEKMVSPVIPAKAGIQHQQIPDQVGDDNSIGIHATYKYDGFRVQLHKNGDEVKMYSRNLEDMTHMFPELIEGARKQITVETAILDTEALAYLPESEEYLPFQETTKRRRKHNIEEVSKQLPLRSFVFDILYADGKSLIDTPLLQRREVMQQVIKGDEILIPSPGVILTKPEDLQLMLDDAFSKGLEGVVVKRPESPYEAGGRNFNWVKLKRHSSGDLSDTIDCVILGYIFGRGKRTEFGAGALLVGVYDKAQDAFVSVSKIGTGLTDEEWRSIKEKTKGLELDHKPARVNSKIAPSVWVKPEIVIEVLADEITRSPLHTAGMNNAESALRGTAGTANGRESLVEGQKKENETNDKRLKTNDQVGYALRFPRLIKFRDQDKKAEDATSVNELVKMYESQGKK